MTGRIQFGDLATWVGGTATSLAFFVTYLLLRAQRTELRASEADRTAREDDRLRDQARFVSAWVVSKSAINPAGTQLTVNVEYRNSSEEPIFGCNLYVLRDFGPEPTVAAREYVGVVPPHGTGVRGFRADVVEGLLTHPPVEIGFTDSRGHHWRRASDGQLVLLLENPDDGVC